MSTKERFIKHYQNGFMPWVHENPDFNLVEIVENWPIKVCNVLEVGCGTGIDAIWLSQQGFQTTAFDLSPIAIEIARENAIKHKAEVDFQICDFVNDELKSNEYGLVFDRGVFHGIETEEERKKFAERISYVLEENGLWLSFIGSADGVKTNPGPPLRTAAEVVSAVEPYFKILAIQASYFGNEQKSPSKIWVCLMRKR